MIKFTHIPQIRITNDNGHSVIAKFFTQEINNGNFIAMCIDDLNINFDNVEIFGTPWYEKAKWVKQNQHLYADVFDLIRKALDATVTSETYVYMERLFSVYTELTRCEFNVHRMVYKVNGVELVNPDYNRCPLKVLELLGMEWTSFEMKNEVPDREEDETPQEKVSVAVSRNLNDIKGELTKYLKEFYVHACLKKSDEQFVTIVTAERCGIIDGDIKSGQTLAYGISTSETILEQNVPSDIIEILKNEFETWEEAHDWWKVNIRTPYLKKSMEDGSAGYKFHNLP